MSLFPSIRSLFFSFLSLSKRLVLCAHLLSLDVALGAMVGNLMVRKVLHVSEQSFSSVLILGLTVFIIYTLDRLGDVRRLTLAPITLRHQFHFRYQQLLWVLVGLVALITALLALLYLPWAMILFGLGLGMLVMAYLLLVYLLGQRGKKWFHKEPLVAVLYTAGVWGSGFVLAKTVSWVEIMVALAFMLIAFQNLLLFSWFEQAVDLRKSERSLPTHWGDAFTQKVLTSIFGLVCLTCILVILLTQDVLLQKASVIELAMSAILYMIGRYPVFFGQSERYRWLGDGVFFLPALLLL